MSGQIGLLAAFGAGIVSFLSPCVLPLIPGYLSFLGSAGARQVDEKGRSGQSLLLHAVLFVAGFTLVFVALGATASALGALLAPYRAVLSRVAGVVVFALGFLLLGVVRVPWLDRELRFDPARTRGLGVWSAPLMGAAFGLGWTPCVGPILGSILALTAQGESVGWASALLLAYSLGLGVPFIAAALALTRIRPVLRLLNRHARAFSIFAGVVLMALGLAMAAGQMERLTALVS